MARAPPGNWTGDGQQTAPGWSQPPMAALKHCTEIMDFSNRAHGIDTGILYPGVSCLPRIAIYSQLCTARLPKHLQACWFFSIQDLYLRHATPPLQLLSCTTFSRSAPE